MANKHKIAEPIYQKIAIDIASKIAAGKYKAGEKIYGRSMLAAHYAVSPETIRRAMFMLQDVGIVAIESGSGSTVLSAERASQLVSRFRNISTITELKKNIETLSEQQKKQQEGQTAGPALSRERRGNEKNYAGFACSEWFVSVMLFKFYKITMSSIIIPF